MAWNPEKAQAFKASFFDFLKYLRIDSKEGGGRSPLTPYGAQLRFLDGVFAGLEQDIHHFVILKARQLGITTISLALDLFWLGVVDGLQGAIVFDKADNMAKGRQLLLRYMESLPRSLHFPGKKTENRNGLWLENGSSLDYLVAGVRKTNGSGGLGRSRALNFVHGTECSSWADEDGLASLERSLAEKFPDRLYIWESTARGFNTFYRMWERAKIDDLTRRAVFIGWWAKEDYSAAKDTPIYKRYGVLPPTADEIARIELVKREYHHEISQEQLAWWRHEEDPASTSPEESSESVGSDILMQELPWHEEDAFLLTGASFFSGLLLSQAAKKARLHPYKGYRYHMAEDFLATSVEQVRTARETQLKVWEEPDPNGIYVIGADPAFGSSETADRYCIQILRCYADGLDQVAEFCTTILTTYQFAWVCAHLCGAYAGQSGSARLILEINGPGEAVLNEFRTLQMIMTTGYMRADAEKLGLKNMFDNVRNYFYQRADSLSRSNLLHFKTNTTLKISIMNRLRDAFQCGQLAIHSLECLEEMSNIVQSGDSIKGEGNSKDDRAMAMAIAVRAWNDSERMRMVAAHRTRENEKKSKTMSTEDMQAMFNRGIVQSFFSEKNQQRRQIVRAARRNRWNW